jgi:hypothetical protein
VAAVAAVGYYRVPVVQPVLILLRLEGEAQVEAAALEDLLHLQQQVVVALLRAEMHPTGLALAVAVVGVRQAVQLVLVLVVLAAKQLTLTVTQLLGQAVIQQEFMGVFHDIFG